MGMNKTMTIAVIALVAVIMGMSALAPAMAKDRIPLFEETCFLGELAGKCIVVVDKDFNGCDTDDRRIILLKSTIDAIGIVQCPASPNL